MYHYIILYTSLLSTHRKYCLWFCTRFWFKCCVSVESGLGKCAVWVVTVLRCFYINLNYNMEMIKNQPQTHELEYIWYFLSHLNESIHFEVLTASILVICSHMVYMYIFVILYLNSVYSIVQLIQTGTEIKYMQYALYAYPSWVCMCVITILIIVEFESIHCFSWLIFVYCKTATCFDGVTKCSVGLTVVRVANYGKTIKIEVITNKNLALTLYDIMCLFFVYEFINILFIPYSS